MNPGDRIREGLERLVERATREAGRRWEPTTLPPASWDFGFPSESYLVVPARGQTVYRTVGRSQARTRDFMSRREKDQPRADDEDHADHQGVSVFASEELARLNAIRFPKMIATVVLSEQEGLCLARTYADIQGHLTVWGDPEVLLSMVEGVSRYDKDV